MFQFLEVIENRFFQEVLDEYLEGVGGLEQRAKYKMLALGIKCKY